ncbi:MAG: phenylacetate--CoA ligase family protein [Candidatus Verstraetearchaeota archaeon]|nr:phenylacetate--CoA ligase family protein [Candidatus Verstraetearchaeota archaeon]
MITSWVSSRLSGAGLPSTREGHLQYVLGRLKQVTGYAYEQSSFYGDLFRAEGITPDTINDLNAFSKLPFTRAEDILKNPNLLLCVSHAEVLRGYTVEMLNGQMKQIFFAQDDLENVINAISSVLDSIGITANGDLAVVFPQEYEWGIPDLMRRAATKSGGRVTLVEEPDLDKQIGKIEALRPEMIVGSAQQLFFLSMVLQKRGNPFGAHPKAVIACHGCVPYLFTEKAKAAVERVFGRVLFEHFGVTETGFNVGVDCRVHDGLHLNEADVYAEVVDPETGEPIPPEERGELVLTSLSQRAMPILRYRTGYISSITDEPCRCGDSLTRRLKIFDTLATEEELLNRPLVFHPF